MLRQRVITAVMIAPVVVGIIMFAGTFWVSILFAGILFAATREMLALTIKPDFVTAVIAAAIFSIRSS